MINIFYLNNCSNMMKCNYDGFKKYKLFLSLKAFPSYVLHIHIY